MWRLKLEYIVERLVVEYSSATKLDCSTYAQGKITNHRVYTGRPLTFYLASGLYKLFAHYRLKYYHDFGIILR